jgi:hypothetical protein
MSVAFGVQSRRQFVRAGLVLPPSLPWWPTRSQPTLRHSGQSGAGPFGEAVARPTVLLLRC